jgi:hypothetical protein
VGQVVDALFREAAPTYERQNTMGKDDLNASDPLDGQTTVVAVANRISSVNDIAQRALTRFNGITVQVGPGPQSDPGVQTALNTLIQTTQSLTNAVQAYLAPVGTSSSIEVKKDIQYLSPTDQARIAHDALSLKLATFKYTNGGERERLGFMLEDAPKVAAADMIAKQVDLYAYTSMVLALVQQQQTEIDALRTEVEKLKSGGSSSR